MTDKEMAPDCAGKFVGRYKGHCERAAVKCDSKSGGASEQRNSSIIRCFLEMRASKCIRRNLSFLDQILNKSFVFSCQCRVNTFIAYIERSIFSV